MKILILSCGTGGGHNTAALAVQENLFNRGIQADFIEYLDIINSKVKESAQQTAAFDEAIKLIAEKQKLEPSEKEYKEKFKEYAEQAGADVDAYVEQVGEDVLKAAILRDAVLDYLVDNCVQVENSDSDADSNSNNKEDSSK